ncbi:hypothetical protein SEA_PUPPER_19 [Gordonia phage Pupper]|uniref:Uncharacterized protein n=1 Tax=Gordonia phage Pupper TaxID=2571249 RepID=A0A4Y6EID7_9CAUD|nr:hypothetical protein KHQ83_gp019 [Gordonia phage Pupper]QDF18506.1 hypothetical protein SEA_PUPPER_19 [Gordonia phage Pupper]QDF18739.1 hypothetical protein SEA_SCENTAE_19 [Gordonia phage SCentae]
MKVTWQIQVEPKPAHPEFHEQECPDGYQLPRVGEYVDYDDCEYLVKTILWQDLTLGEVLIILAEY